MSHRATTQSVLNYFSMRVEVYDDACRVAAFIVATFLLRDFLISLNKPMALNCAILIRTHT